MYSTDYDDILRDITKPRYITAFEAIDSGIYWIGFEYLGWCLCWNFYFILINLRGNRGWGKNDDRKAAIIQFKREHMNTVVGNYHDLAGISYNCTHESNIQIQKHVHFLTDLISSINQTFLHQPLQLFNKSLFYRNSPFFSRSRAPEIYPIFILSWNRWRRHGQAVHTPRSFHRTGRRELSYHGRICYAFGTAQVCFIAIFSKMFLWYFM